MSTFIQLYSPNKTSANVVLHYTFHPTYSIFRIFVRNVAVTTVCFQNMYQAEFMPSLCGNDFATYTLGLRYSM